MKRIEYPSCKRAILTVLLAGLILSCAPKTEVNGERIWQGSTQSGTRQFITLSQEERSWVVSQFEANPGKLQDAVAKKSFGSEQEALGWAIVNANRMNLKQRPRSRSGSQPIQGLKFQTATEVPGEVLWKTKQNWDWQWEVQYGKWISTELKIDTLKRLNIATDCADLAYVLRWIFARIHGLPAANRLAGSGAFFSNESMRDAWVNLGTSSDWKTDQRFLAALNYLMINTYTHTLQEDSYPIKISAEAMLPGAFHLDFNQEEGNSDSGHTMIVYQLDPDNREVAPLEMIYSTVPRGVRELLTGTFWQGEPPDPTHGDGFLRFRWPVESSDGAWSLVAAKAMPFYSLEQYSKDFMGGGTSFSQAVEKRISPHYDPMARLKAGVERLREKIVTREDFVEKGYKACSQGQCPKKSKLYEDWSTPVRDASLSEMFLMMQDFVSGEAETRPDIMHAWDRVLATVALTLPNGDQLSYGQLQQIWAEHKYSSEPGDSIRARWGI